MVKQALFIAGCVAGFGLQACNNSAADPAKVAAEVQKAEAEGEKKIVEAQAKLEKVAAENKKDIVVARADARIDAVDDATTKSADTARFEAGKTDAKQPEAKDVLKKTFADAKLPAEIEVYKGTLHGWCPPDSKVYNQEQAEKAWSRLLATFKGALT